MSGPADDALRATFGGDVRLHQITPHVDDRGSLVELELTRDLGGLYLAPGVWASQR